MVSIRAYLHELEARLAPTLEVHILRERLTEAEVHLRDRAQEFEEIGLPPHEAEVRAVAAFGMPEEYAEDVPVPSTASRPTEVPAPSPSGDVSLQLAWSAVGLGLVSMLVFSYSGYIGGIVAAVFVLLGALFGQRTPLRRLIALASVAAFALFPILMGAYTPTPLNSLRPTMLGARLSEDRRIGELNKRLSQDLAAYETYQKGFSSGKIPQNEQGRNLGPDRDFGRSNFPFRYEYSVEPYGLKEYDDQATAAAMWTQEGEIVHQRLVEARLLTFPSVSELSAPKRATRFALTSVLGGILLLAVLSGAQALGFALRGFLGWLRRSVRRPPPQPQGQWERR